MSVLCFVYLGMFSLPAKKPEIGKSCLFYGNIIIYVSY